MGDDDFGDWEGAPPASNHVAELSHAASPLKAQLSQDQSQEELSPVSRQPDMDLTGLRSYRKGDLCWYMTRSGTWEAVEVVSVDHTVSPPSFGVQVEGVYRETEWYRLRPRTLGQPPPPPPKRTPRRAAAAAAAAARPARQPQLQQQNGELLNPSHAPAMHAVPQSPAAHTAAVAAAAVAAAPSSPVPPLPTMPSPPGSAAAAEDDDAFGEFESAWPAPVAAQVVEPSPLVQHPGPSLQHPCVQQPGPPLQHPLMQQPALQHPLQQQPPAPAPWLSPPATSQPAASGLWQRWHQRQQKGAHGVQAHSLPAAPLHLDQQQLSAQSQVQLLFPSYPQPPSPPSCAPPPQQHQPQQQQQHQQQHQPQQQHSFWPSGTHTHVTPPTSPTKSKSQSPAVDRFHSFLRMAVPEGALRRLSLDGNSGEAAGAGPGVDGGAAAPAAASLAGPSSPGVASPRLGHGVDRAAPLPLDIFGEEGLPGEDPPVALPPALPSSPPAAGAAPTAGAQHGQQQQQQQQALASPKAAIAAAGVAPGPQGGPAALPAGGSGQEDDDWGDDFGDFVEAGTEPASLPVSPEVPVAVPASAVPAPASSGSQAGSVPSSPPRSHHRTPSVGDSAAEIHGSGEAGGGKGAGKPDVVAVAVAADAGGLAAAPAALVEPVVLEQQQPAVPMPQAAAAAGVQAGGSAGPASVASAAGSSQRTSLDEQHHVASPVAASGAVTASAVMPTQQPQQQQQQQQAGAPVAAEAVVPSSWSGQPKVADYGVAWVLLLEAAARHLELGQRLWGQACTCSSCCASALLGHQGAQQYLASLGQVFLAASAVQVAARLLGLFGLVTEMQEAWARCLAAWEAPAPTQQQQQPQQEEEEEQQGSVNGEAGVALLSFRQAVERASSGGSSSSSGDPGQEQPGSPAAEQEPPQRVQQDEVEEGGTHLARHDSLSLASQLEVLHRAEAEAAGLPSDAFPRMLEWCEGLDGITLLPLCLLEGLPVSSGAAWLKGRPCLAAVGNLWAGCIRKPVDLD